MIFLRNPLGAKPLKVKTTSTYLSTYDNKANMECATRLILPIYPERRSGGAQRKHLKSLRKLVSFVINLKFNAHLPEFAIKNILSTSRQVFAIRVFTSKFFKHYFVMDKV